MVAVAAHLALEVARVGSDLWLDWTVREAMTWYPVLPPSINANFAQI
jgi:hypothetical protein